MRIASLADVKARLSAYVDECEAAGPIVITRNGKTAAVLVAPQSDDDLENLLIARSPRLQTLLSKSRHSVETGKWLTSKDFWSTVAARSLANMGGTQKQLRPIRRRRSDAKTR